MRGLGWLLSSVVLVSGATVGHTDEPRSGYTGLQQNVPDPKLRWQVAIVPAEAAPGDEVEVVLTTDIPRGWILYSSDFTVEIGPRPAKVSFDATPALTLIGTLQPVGSYRKQDRSLGIEYSYFESRAEFRQKARLLAPLQATGARLSGRINGQTCFEENGLCQLFRQDFHFPE